MKICLILLKKIALQGLNICCEEQSSSGPEQKQEVHSLKKEILTKHMMRRQIY